ncbi:MAG TPA: hypothetical protein VLA72_17355 [Anaerolineales bacterium]|nr:hypothetical protein [Anaerolineales bacterium]
MPENFNPLIIPIASSMVGLIPFLINLAINHFDKKSHKAQRDADLQYLNQRINYLNSWFNLHKDVSGQDQLSRVREVVSDELEEVYEEFAHALLEVDKESKKRHDLMLRVKNTNFIKKLFLLYTLYNVRGWLYHTLFYMCTLPLVAGFGFEIYKYLQTQTWFSDVPDEFLIVGIALAVLAILFHWLGRASARDTEQRMATLERKTTPLGKSASS